MLALRVRVNRMYVPVCTAVCVVDLRCSSLHWVSRKLFIYTSLFNTLAVAPWIRLLLNVCVANVWILFGFLMCTMSALQCVLRILYVCTHYILYKFCFCCALSPSIRKRYRCAYGKYTICRFPHTLFSSAFFLLLLLLLLCPCVMGMFCILSQLHSISLSFRSLFSPNVALTTHKHTIDDTYAKCLRLKNFLHIFTYSHSSVSSQSVKRVAFNVITNFTVSKMINAIKCRLFLSGKDLFFSHNEKWCHDNNRLKFNDAFDATFDRCRPNVLIHENIRVENIKFIDRFLVNVKTIRFELKWASCEDLRFFWGMLLSLHQCNVMCILHLFIIATMENLFWNVFSFELRKSSQPTALPPVSTILLENVLIKK